MGKLIQKIVNGFVPSWLTRIKSSAHALPKRLLPPSSTHIHDHEHSGRSGKIETAAPATSCSDSSVLPCSANSMTPPSMQLKKTRMKHNAGKHTHSDNIAEHQCHPRIEDNNNQCCLHVDMNDTSLPMYSPTTQIQAANQRADEVVEDRNHRPQHQHHYTEAERANSDHVLQGSKKLSPHIQCMQEEDNAYGHRKLQDGYHEQPHAKHQHNYVGLKTEIECTHEERKNRRDLLGFKRKSTYAEEDDDDDDNKKAGGDGRSSISGWGWKRRKREEGLMSCELPGSVCSVVGNARAVVKYSQEPHQALWESMVEMIVGNGLRELGSLEFLLFCYLSLNEPHLHSIIQSSFLRVLKDLNTTF